MIELYDEKGNWVFTLSRTISKSVFITRKYPPDAEGECVEVDSHEICKLIQKYWDEAEVF